MLMNQHSGFFMRIIVVILLLCSLHAKAQVSFMKLSCPEKWWVVSHLFVAKKAQRITQKVRKEVQSMKSSGELDGDADGGQLDAFRHSYWMALLSKEIGSKKARKLGIAHEKGNYRTFKKAKLEDGSSPDKVATDMDLFNNERGITIAENNTDQQSVKQTIIEDILAGKMKIIKKDQKGHSLSCDGKLISPEALNKWETERCLVDSNQ